MYRVISASNPAGSPLRSLRKMMSSFIVHTPKPFGESRFHLSDLRLWEFGFIFSRIFCKKQTRAGCGQIVDKPQFCVK